ncbi:hypothetical protein ATO10_02075 [Actibacterium atlanticum]|uniref:Bacteriophage phiJL001 Gp84 C-terminal domain-containing protein n=1 Tax=Actibacterium atlanticum TaxID=1461693 RepID=A0A058ZPI4_9RHOB|nr:DUF2163 domain-containing protein [Actibacterium atlanticum]KCV83509.1 hypothetical protein ATO10_02075 [Actibacterium atlanticum]
MAIPSTLQAHLGSGATTVCRCWAVARRDGQVLGFTDHDSDIGFEGIAFKANSGMTARALSQTSGLSVDNTEALGALSDASVTEADILAGRFDGAVVRSWLVNWQSPEDRALQFSGTFGEVARSGGAFEAELRGLTEALNQPQGAIYQRPCTAILGDNKCKFDLNTDGYVANLSVETVIEARLFTFDGQDEFEPRWFEAGVLEVRSGPAKGLTGVIKNDRYADGVRRVELWESLRAVVNVGDQLKLTAGCDKRAETCRVKFSNFNNFRGFPHIPGEDWLISYPVKDGPNDGGSLNG